MNFLLHILILSFILSCGTADLNICPQVVIHGDEDFKLDDTEKRMVCGDPELAAYKEIPSYQAEYFFKGFLQSQGYLEPRFETEQNVLHVHLGEKSYLKETRVVSQEKKENAYIERRTRRLFKRKLLSPTLLNSIESQGLSFLRQRGYPCAKVESHFNTDDSSVTLTLEKLNYFEFGEFEKEKLKGLEDNALARFYPMRSGDPFNEKLLALTEKRMLRSEVVQGTYFLEKCDADGKTFSFSQQFIQGPAKSIRFGVGASTEVGPMVRVKWANNRFRPMASHLSASLQASFRTQSLNLTADYFPWTQTPRRSLFSQLELVRESQIDYEQLVLRAKPHMKWTSDHWAHHFIYTFGPTYETGRFTASNQAITRNFSTGAVEGSLKMMAHDYEIFDLHPQEGDNLEFSFDFRHPALGFTDQILKLESSWVKLARLSEWGRGTVIGGLRLSAATTMIDDDVPLENLPPTVKFFGGGSDDVRGFLLRTLPKNDGLGALTKLGSKFELRRTYLFKESIEAFAFVDAAYFGDESWDLLPTLWYSPGLGLRWLSPIGLVQTYAARAFSTKPQRDYGNFFYIGLGGVF
ncbi:MAG TPA: BamA/TamA family outer membrane protein [Bacteriovoracaceae bacterium]|nr:BamA/TamA family outer membrane protein [Bacteriovoracaceae bacterium]